MGIFDRSGTTTDEAEGADVQEALPTSEAGSTASAMLERAPGLPADGSEDHFFAFGQDGGVWAVQWSKEHEAFVAVGFDGRWPSTMILKGDAKAQIASHLKAPIHLLD